MLQQPRWPDAAAVERSLKQISTMPPLVFAGEARSLQAELARVAAGNAFLLQAGDCAESFEEFSADNIREKLRVILQMAIILTYSVGVPIVKVGRMAGQFAKPRSADMETVGGLNIPSFRGDIVNDATASEAARIPDPERLVQAYNQSASTLNLLRAFTKGGFADLSHVHSWTQEFVASSPEGRRYERQPVRGRRVHLARGAAARIRGIAHPQGLAHGRLVRLLGAHVVDRRADP